LDEVETGNMDDRDDHLWEGRGFGELRKLRRTIGFKVSREILVTNLNECRGKKAVESLQD